MKNKQALLLLVSLSLAVAPGALAADGGSGRQEPNRATAALPAGIPTSAQPAVQPKAGFQPRIQPFESPEKEKPKEDDGQTVSPTAPPVRTTPIPSSTPTPHLPKAQPAAGAEGQEDKPAEVFIRLAVRHNQHPVDTITAYPYPVMPPKIFKEIEPLPTERRDLKGMLLGIGYTTRWHGDEPYPPYGWRFQYAYEGALRKSGRSVPHSILSIYHWEDKMVPYIRPEIERINKEEEERKQRYDDAVALYKNKYLEIQNESTRLGMFAVPFRMYKKGQGYARLPAGNWWIAGSRKVPGLFYYWEQPITVAPGSSEVVQLTEPNALLIQGGW